MDDSIQGQNPLNPPPVNRRTFIKTAGAAALVVGGIEGILAAGCAPAFAQGTKLHWVRWVDFIAESDVELKRQIPEASKALGVHIELETINANDLQPRITAAIQSGSGPDIFLFQYGSPAESVGRNGPEFELWTLPGWFPALGKPGFPQIPQLRRRALDPR